MIYSNFSVSLKVTVSHCFITSRCIKTHDNVQVSLCSFCCDLQCFSYYFISNCSRRFHFYSIHHTTRDDTIPCQLYFLSSTISLHAWLTINFVDLRKTVTPHFCLYLSSCLRKQTILLFYFMHSICPGWNVVTFIKRVFSCSRIFVWIMIKGLF